MAWCLRPEFVDKFKKAIKSGELDPFKMADMSSDERRSLIAKYVGKENAKQVNALYESKLLLKNQQAGMINWVKRTAGMSPEVKRDMISRIQRLDTVLNPEEGDQFLRDLASSRLRIDITQEEAQQIHDLSQEVEKTSSKANEEGVFQNKKDRLAYGLAKVNLENYVNELKLQSKKISLREEPVRKVLNTIGQVPGTAKSLVASFDNSLWGRQGIKTLLDLRTSGIWTKNFAKSFKDIGKQIVAKGDWYTAGDDAVMDFIKADIYSRPNALNGKYKAGGYGLDVFSEEAFPSSLPEAIPGFGRLFKASEVAYNGGALRLRADLADRLIAKAESFGINTKNPDEAKALGNLVSSMTGRGSLGKADVISKELNVLLFSVKFLKSNIDTLTAHATDSKATPFTRAEARKNLASMVGTVATITLLAGLLDPDSVDPDPRSTNFGKIKIFGKWADITGGMASLVRLASYIIPTQHNGKWSLWKKSSSGNWTDLRSKSFGSTDAFDTLIDGLFTNKLSPIAGLIRDGLRGEMFGGKEFNTKNVLMNLTLPLSIQNFIELKNDPNAAFPLGSMLLDGFGLSVSSYNYKTDWEKSTSKIYSDFKSQVGEEEFKRANDDFNRAYNIWFEKAKGSDEYKKLSDDAKKSLNTKAKEKIRDQVMLEYGYKETKQPKTQKEKDAEKLEKESIENLLPDEARARTTSVVNKLKDVLAKVELVPSVSAKEGKETITDIQIIGDSVVTTYVDEDGNFVAKRSENIDAGVGIIGKTIGKAFDSIGRSLGLEEKGISEIFGYEDKQKRIDKLMKYVGQIDSKLDEKIEVAPEMLKVEEKIDVQQETTSTIERDNLYAEGTDVAGNWTRTKVPKKISDIIQDVFADKAQEAVDVLHHPFEKQVKGEGHGENAGFITGKGWNDYNYDDNGNLKYVKNPFSKEMEPNEDRGLFRINNQTFYDYLSDRRDGYRNAMFDAGIIDSDNYKHIDAEKAAEYYDRMYDPELNIRMAKIIYEKQGWRAWFAAPERLSQ